MECRDRRHAALRPSAPPPRLVRGSLRRLLPEEAPEERGSRNKRQNDQKAQFLREDGEDGEGTNTDGFGQLHPKDAGNQTGREGGAAGRVRASALHG